MRLRRHLLGLIAAMLLVAWLALLLLGPSDGKTRTIASICMRSGLVLGALWLALPQVISVLARFPPWLIAAFVLGAAAVVARPRLIAVIAPLLAAMAVLQFLGWLFKPLPPPKRRDRDADSSSGRDEK